MVRESASYVVVVWSENAAAASRSGARSATRQVSSAVYARGSGRGRGR